MRSTSLASSSIVALGEDDLFRQQQFNAQLLEKLARPIDPGPHLRIKGRLLNLWGIMYAVNTIIAVIIMLPFMAVGAIISDMSGRKKQRKIVDWFVHLWANLALTMSFCRPQVYGLENLPKSDEPVMFVPNHTSFVDILVFSGFVPRPFKYLSKAEILKIPLIGWGMQMARHVFLTRGDLKSTIACTELCVERVSIKLDQSLICLCYF